MVHATIRASFAYALAVCIAALGIEARTLYGVGEALEQPASVSPSAGGNTTANLTIGAALYEGPQYKIYTRLYNGDIPGPTLRVKKGGTLHVELSNALEGAADGGNTRENEMGHPNYLCTGEDAPVVAQTLESSGAVPLAFRLALGAIALLAVLG